MVSCSCGRYKSSLVISMPRNKIEPHRQQNAASELRSSCPLVVVGGGVGSWCRTSTVLAKDCVAAAGLVVGKTLAMSAHPGPMATCDKRRVNRIGIAATKAPVIRQPRFWPASRARRPGCRGMRQEGGQWMRRRHGTPRVQARPRALAAPAPIGRPLHACVLLSSEPLASFEPSVDKVPTFCTRRWLGVSDVPSNKTQRSATVLLAP